MGEGEARSDGNQVRQVSSSGRARHRPIPTNFLRTILVALLLEHAAELLIVLQVRGCARGGPAQQFGARIREQHSRSQPPGEKQAR